MFSQYQTYTQLLNLTSTFKISNKPTITSHSVNIQQKSHIHKPTTTTTHPLKHKIHTLTHHQHNQFKLGYNFTTLGQ